MPAYKLKRQAWIYEVSSGKVVHTAFWMVWICISFSQENELQFAPKGKGGKNKEESGRAPFIMPIWNWKLVVIGICSIYFWNEVAYLQMFKVCVGVVCPIDVVPLIEPNLRGNTIPRHVRQYV